MQIKLSDAGLFALTHRRQAVGSLSMTVTEQRLLEVERNETTEMASATRCVASRSNVTPEAVPHQKPSGRRRLASWAAGGCIPESILQSFPALSVGRITLGWVFALDQSESKTASSPPSESLRLECADIRMQNQLQSVAYATQSASRNPSSSSSSAAVDRGGPPLRGLQARSCCSLHRNHCIRDLCHKQS